MAPSDDVLWWVMVSVAIVTAGLSIATSVLDRRDSRSGLAASTIPDAYGELCADDGLSVLILWCAGLLGPG